ncbi:MAG: hypothetical protein RR058_08250, partial [Oscillospiraceae bacterium]
ALLGLIEILRQADAELVGCGIAIEKRFQDGGRLIRGMGGHHRRSTRKNAKKQCLPFEFWGQRQRILINCRAQSYFRVK